MNNWNQVSEDLKKSCPEKDQYFFGHGKVLLTGEYFVLDGALSLALPTKLGQSLSVKYNQSYNPCLKWKSIDVEGKTWFEHKFEFWHFKCLDENQKEVESNEVNFLQKLLIQVRKQNPHFLRDEVEVSVETRLGFPLSWGLGSSSSLIYNIAQWAYVSPFELLFKTHGGSGYDIACAQSETPILYRKSVSGPNWSPTTFNPTFRENLYFVYLGHKRNSREAVKEYSKKRPVDQKIIQEITEITNKILETNSLSDFSSLIDRHEDIVGNFLGETPVKKLLFNDFNGAVKSLGAWGGDFILVATDENHEAVKKYFKSKDLDVVLKFDDIIMPSFKSDFLDGQKSPSNNLVH